MKRLVKKVMATTMATAMVFTMAPYVSADDDPATTVNGANGVGVALAPVDIIDVVVPTQFKVAFNPLMVDTKGSINGLEGKTEIISGTYAIENRSTIPVSVNVGFEVTLPDSKTALLASDEAVETFNNTETNFTENADTALPSFSLGLITTASGAAQSPGEEPQDKVAAGRTDNVTADEKMESPKTKLAKASTSVLPIAAATGKSYTFWLDKGPYTPKFVAGRKDTDGTILTQDHLEYDIKAGAKYDTVAFTFTGLTSKNINKWAALADAEMPSVKATYTLTESNDITYNKQGYSPIWKGIKLEDPDAKVKIGTTEKTNVITSEGNATLTFDAALDLKKNKEGNIDLTANKLDILSLQPDKKKTSVPLDAVEKNGSKPLNLGVTAQPVVTQEDLEATPAKYANTTITISGAEFAKIELVKGTPIPSGFYLVSFGKTSIIVKYTKAS